MITFLFIFICFIGLCEAISLKLQHDMNAILMKRINTTNERIALTEEVIESLSRRLNAIEDQEARR